jgi:hypothetical protein
MAVITSLRRDAYDPPQLLGTSGVHPLSSRHLS